MSLYLPTPSLKRVRNFCIMILNRFKVLFHIKLSQVHFPPVWSVYFAYVMSFTTPLTELNWIHFSDAYLVKMKIDNSKKYCNCKFQRINGKSDVVPWKNGVHIWCDYFTFLIRKNWLMSCCTTSPVQLLNVKMACHTAGYTNYYVSTMVSTIASVIIFSHLYFMHGTGHESQDKRLIGSLLDS